MKIKLLIIFFLIFHLQLQAQKSAPKTRILLIGTFSFEKAALNNSTENQGDFQSTKRQQEILNFIKNKSFTGAKKILLEIPYKKQLYADSVYSAFLQNNYSLSPNENEQIGFRLAKELKLKSIYAMDDKTPIKKDSVLVVAAQLNRQQDILEELNLRGESIKTDFDSVLNSSSLTGILAYINSSAFQLRNLSLYDQYMVKVGAGKNYEGVQYVGDRYLRCLRIYANILSDVTTADDFVIVFIGQGYLPFLRDFFRGNADFEVMDYSTIGK